MGQVAGTEPAYVANSSENAGAAWSGLPLLWNPQPRAPGRNQRLARASIRSGPGLQPLDIAPVSQGISL